MTEKILARWPRSEPLVRGVLVQRYKRFLSDVKLQNGEIVTAHCVNTGTMEGLTRPGTPVWLSRSNNPKRKLAYTWELAEVDGCILGVNTNLPNRMVGRLLAEKKLSWLSHWPAIRPEKKYGEKSRVDFWLSGNGGEHFLEVKNCHLLYPDKAAYFPDCVSTRAAGHLAELCNCLTGGDGRVSAEVLFFVQIAGAQIVRPSDLHDPVFAAAARDAAARGVKFSAVGMQHSETELVVYGPIPVDLEPYDTGNHVRWRAGNAAG